MAVSGLLVKYSKGRLKSGDQIMADRLSSPGRPSGSSFLRPFCYFTSPFPALFTFHANRIINPEPSFNINTPATGAFSGSAFEAGLKLIRLIS